MEDGETEEDVNIDIEIPSNILKNILDNSRKRKADSSTDCRHCKVYVSETVSGEVIPRDVEGDRRARLEEYCNWGLTQVDSDRWRNVLQIAN
jgi:hypothetical protein